MCNCLARKSETCVSARPQSQSETDDDCCKRKVKSVPGVATTDEPAGCRYVLSVD